MQSRLIFEQGRRGRRATRLPDCTVGDEPISALVPKKLLRSTPPELPEVAEIEMVRHYTNLARKNFSVDTHFYPLGSCTMKYSPKVNEFIAALPGFLAVHPWQPDETVQGLLELLWDTEQALKEITGMERFTFQPAAGAHGELTGLMLVHAYHDKKGNKKSSVVVPDSSHGTNPASATISGYECVSVRSNEHGEVDIDALAEAMEDGVAAIMMTNPNTLGLFETQILEIRKLAAKHDALLYYDGANLNALLGVARPGDMGFDVVHLNLHKTFSTPHGGGGPGSGPVGVNARLAPFLPVPLVEKRRDRFVLDTERPDSIGMVRSFYGNIGVVVRAYTYIRALGAEGLKRVGKAAVVNANYLRKRLERVLRVPYSRPCMHEFVASADKQKARGVSAMDIAKALLDEGMHAPTAYFPLIVPEALMIEPTETETRETLDAFADAIEKIDGLIDEKGPEWFAEAPRTTPVTRLDEVAAARRPVLRWRKGN
jgi:glycine dehydrogenase subunit 2